MQSVYSKKKNVSRYTHETESFWKEHQTNFSVSGLSRVEYCKVQKISYGRFTYWLSNLPPALLQERVKKEQSLPKPLPLLQVQVKPESRLLNTLCSLTLKNGLTLNIHDPSILSWLIKEGV